jgi:hypothetical protein
MARRRQQTSRAALVDSPYKASMPFRTVSIRFRSSNSVSRALAKTKMLIVVGYRRWCGRLCDHMAPLMRKGYFERRPTYADLEAAFVRKHSAELPRPLG